MPESETLFTFPQAPNWFSAHALSSVCVVNSQSRIFAYASRNDIVIVQDSRGLLSNETSESETRVFRDQAEYPQISLLNPGREKSKVIAVDLIADGDQLRLLAGLEDGFVLAWEFASITEVASQNANEHSKHKVLSKDRWKILSVCWSQTSKRIAISGDESGKIVVWDTLINSTRSMSFNKFAIIAMKSSPFLPDVIAIGFKGGLIIIADINGNGKVIHKLRGHDEDIQSLSWCPVAFNVLDQFQWQEQNPETNCLLVASSKDRSFSIWTTKKGQRIGTLHLARLKGDKQNSWNSCCWVSANQIVTNGSTGQLVLWNMDKLPDMNDGFFRGDEKIAASEQLHHEHSKIITCIQAGSNRIYTVGHERSVVSFNLESKTLDYNLPAFQSWIYCVAPNCIEPSTLAIGSGDGLIRIWRTNSHTSLFDVSLISQKLSSAKVTALAWHPKEEQLLAFGTDEGRIGIVDALNPQRNTPQFINFQHRGTIYNVCWGPKVCRESPSEPHSDGKLMLYTCADSKIFMHNPRQEAGGSKSLDDILVNKDSSVKKSTRGYTEMSFHPRDHKFLAIGFDDGTVEIMQIPNLKTLIVIKTFQKMIQNIAWHSAPETVNLKGESKDVILAVASNDHDVHVYGFAQSELSSENENVSLITSPNLVLSGHLARVIHLSWGEGSYLVSVSYDGSAQVWDVSEGEAVGNFHEHSGRLLCCLVSQEDEDVVFTGSDDCTLRAWRISSLKKKFPTKKSTRPVKTKQKAIKVPPNEEQSNKDLKEVEALLQDKKEQILNDQCNSTLKGITNNSAKGIKEKVLFQGITKKDSCQSNLEAFEDCLRISNAEDTLSEENQHLAFFFDQESSVKALDRGADFLLKNGHFEGACVMRQWHGDSSEVISAALKAGQLSDFIVNVAAGVSRQLFVNVCEAYAQQLVANGNPIKASSYYLIVHKVSEAIDVLIKEKQFRSALGIARSRLDPSSPVIKEILTAWAAHLVSDGAYEMAAQCWVSANEPLKAANILGKRKDVEALRIAACLALEGGEPDTAKMLATQCLTLCKESANQECLEKVVSKFGTLLNEKP